MNPWTNLRFSARSFARTPLLAFTLIATIALGIGSNASVQGFARGLVTPTLPIPDAANLVSIYTRDEQGAVGPLSYASYIALGEHRDIFDTIGAVRETQSTLAFKGATSVISLATMTPAFARLVQLPEGVTVSDRLWRTMLGSTDDLGSQQFRIDGNALSPSHIAPGWLEGVYRGRSVDVWMPLQSEPAESERETRVFWVLARLHGGRSVADAQAILRTEFHGNESIEVAAYTGMAPDMSVGLARVSRLLIAATALVFLIACANVASFLLARASARSHETSVRAAIGANRAQLTTQLVTDSVLLSLAGGAFGLLFAVWTAQLVPALFFEEDAARLVFALDYAAVAMVAAACTLITVVCGLLPLFELRRLQPAAVLQRESAGPGPTWRRVRAALVVAQMGGCCFLLVTTGFLMQAFRNALDTNMGQRLGHPLIATVHARPPSSLRESAVDIALDYFRRIERSARNHPDITSAAWVARLPGSRPSWQSMTIEPPEWPSRDVVLHVESFTSRTLSSVTLPPVQGRAFGAADTPASCRAVMVTKDTADAIFEGDAVGRAIEDPTGRQAVVVGVVTRPRSDVAAPQEATVFYYPEQTLLPVEREGLGRFRVPVPTSRTRALLDAHVVSPNFFEALGLKTIEGRVFTDRADTGGCPVGVVNREAAEQFFGGKAVGGAVINAAGQRTEIIGIVETLQLRAAQRRIEPAIYFPMTQHFVPRMTVILGTTAPQDDAIASLKRRLDAVQGGIEEVAVISLETHLGRNALAAERIAAILVSASAATAFLLGTIGVYGVMAESVRLRRRELALRVALGAQAWRVLRQVLVEGLRLAGIGAGAGLIAALVIAQWLTPTTSGTIAFGGAWWISIPIVVLVSVLVAGIVPAHRAMSVDIVSLIRDK